jgi:hypothetical protein
LASRHQKAYSDDDPAGLHGTLSGVVKGTRQESGGVSLLGYRCTVHYRELGTILDVDDDDDAHESDGGEKMSYFLVQKVKSRGVGF